MREFASLTRPSTCEQAVTDPPSPLKHVGETQSCKHSESHIDKVAHHSMSVCVEEEGDSLSCVYKRRPRHTIKTSVGRAKQTV